MAKKKKFDGQYNSTAVEGFKSNRNLKDSMGKTAQGSISGLGHLAADHKPINIPRSKGTPSYQYATGSDKKKVTSTSKPKTSTNSSKTINKYEIERKARSGEKLSDPTPEKQRIYDSYKRVSSGRTKNPNRKMSKFERSETIRKAKSGQKLSDPTAEKLALFNQTQKQQRKDTLESAKKVGKALGGMSRNTRRK